MMRSDLAFYSFASILLILLYLWLRQLWRGGKTAPAVPKPPRLKRNPKSFAGLTRKPDCEACEQGVVSHPQAPGAPPPRMILARGRHRQVDTSGHFCPREACSYHGRIGFSNLHANGHPNGRRWRQLYCLGCHSYFLETHDTPFHAKQVDPNKLVWAITALAEGLGIRAVARVFEVDPNTVLSWLVEATEHLEAFSRYFLHDVDVEQVQMDELFALLNLDLRQHVAAIGRRVNTLCKHEAGVRQQLAIFHTYHNFVLPHASLRLPQRCLSGGCLL